MNHFISTCFKTSPQENLNFIPQVEFYSILECATFRPANKYKEGPKFCKMNKAGIVAKWFLANKEKPYELVHFFTQNLKYFVIFI